MTPAIRRILRLLSLLALTAAVPFAGFCLYAHGVMASPEMERLKKASRFYPCIGAVHDPKRPQARPQPQIARFHLQFRNPDISYGPSWHVRFTLAIAAIDWSVDSTHANRLFAALPMGSHGNFDAVAERYSQKRFCALDGAHRQAIRDFFWSGRVQPLEEAFGRHPSP